MKMDCFICGRNINEINQDNMSPVSGLSICEDCIGTVGIAMPTEPCASCYLAEWIDIYGVLNYACDMSHCIADDELY